MKITVETVVRGRLNQVWAAWNTPADIRQWNTAQDDWHTTRSTVDLREGGKFLSRMEAKEGSEGFDFEGTYTRIVPHRTIEYRMSDGREVKVEFVEQAGGVLVKETFDTETENPPELQREGWQAILNNFRRHVESKEGHMKKSANARFAIESWNEKPYDEGQDQPRLTRASVAKTYTGDVEGNGQVEYLMMYRADDSATFVGLERVVGRIGGKAGTFVLQRTGVFESGQAKESYSVIPGSATGDLQGLVGDGSSAVGHGLEHPFTLSYELP